MVPNHSPSNLLKFLKMIYVFHLVKSDSMNVICLKNDLVLQDETGAS